MSNGIKPKKNETVTTVADNPDVLINDFERRHIKKGTVQGIFCSDIDEPIPVRDPAPCEVKIGEGKHNSAIYAGRDRTGSFMSGAGGEGLTQCGMLDLVAGMGSGRIAENIKKGKYATDMAEKVNPIFAIDAARVYITQKNPNIDKAIGIPCGYKGPDEVRTRAKSDYKSAVLVKADHTRIVGRERVRIIAAQTKNVSGLGRDGERTARGSKIDPGNGIIELIAGGGNEASLQPMVRGYELKRYLEKMSKKINNVREQLYDLEKKVVKIAAISGILDEVFLGGTINLKGDIKDSIKKMGGNIKEVIQQHLHDANALDTQPIKGVNSILSNNCFNT